MSRRVVMCLSLLILGGVVVSLLMRVGGSGVVFGLSWATSQALGGATPSPTPRPVASSVQAFYQGDPNAGWNNRAQFETWWESACSPAALTMTLRAWGAQVRIGQVLDRLIAHRAISVEGGLLRAGALTDVAKEYGFAGTTFWQWKLEDVAKVTRQGVPVLVDVVDAKRQTPYPAFSVGHWLVVVGVSGNQVEVRDSSGYHLRVLSRSMFHTLFTGIGVVVWQGVPVSLP